MVELLILNLKSVDNKVSGCLKIKNFVTCLLSRCVSGHCYASC